MRKVIGEFTDRFTAFFYLPVFRKELVELAVRRRTYITRVVYAVLLLGLFLLFEVNDRNVFRDHRIGGQFSQLGRGGRVLNQVLSLQFFGIILFLPAIMIGRMVHEKERQTLPLLLITRLTAWEIILQKYLGGMWAFVSILLLTLPLAGFAYTLGGLDDMALIHACVDILATAMLVGAWALACAVYCSTTMGAFVGCYALGIPIWLGYRVFDESVLGAVSPVLEALRLYATSMLRAGAGSLMDRFAATLALLVVSRYVLIARSHQKPRNRLKRAFQWLDKLFERANRRFGNIEIVRTEHSLPANRPIAWREVNRRSLGQFRYLVRIVLPLVVSVLFCRLILMSGAAGTIDLGVLWLLAILLLTVQAVSSIQSERTNQTLEVLLTTPMTGRQILREKETALVRLSLFLSIPFLLYAGMSHSVYADLAENLRRGYYFSGEPVPAGFITFHAVLTYFCYSQIVIWIGLRAGLKSRNALAGITKALAFILVWVAAPFLVVLAIGLMGGVDIDNSVFYMLAFLGSGTPFLALLDGGRNLEGNIIGDQWFVFFLWHYVVCIVLWIYLRWDILGRGAGRKADRFLRRLAAHGRS